ncbi:single stranded DNA-binding protein [Roseateles asaccharophilus]|uniref:single-stranded DNA-binding protein n=1 Tax=Roseateles asaccharophilus TaxID=582607 RepID=UPI0038389AE2
MVTNVNKIIIIGAIGENLSISNGGFGGDLLAEFEVATATMEWDGDAQRERVDYHFVVAEGQLAGLVKEEMGIGSLVYIEGELRTERLAREDKPGAFDYIATVSADSIRLLASPAAEEAVAKIEAITEIASQVVQPEAAAAPSAPAQGSRIVRPHKAQPSAAAPSPAPEPTVATAQAETTSTAAPVEQSSSQPAAASQPQGGGEVKPWLMRGRGVKKAA